MREKEQKSNLSPLPPTTPRLRGSRRLRRTDKNQKPESKYNFKEFEIGETEERFRYFNNGRVEKIDD